MLAVLSGWQLAMLSWFCFVGEDVVGLLLGEDVGLLLGETQFYL